MRSSCHATWRWVAAALQGEGAMSRAATGGAEGCRVEILGGGNTPYVQQPSDEEVAAIVAALDAFAAEQRTPTADDATLLERWRIEARRAAVDRWATGRMHRRWTGRFE